MINFQHSALTIKRGDKILEMPFVFGSEKDLRINLPKKHKGACLFATESSLYLLRYSRWGYSLNHYARIPEATNAFEAEYGKMNKHKQELCFFGPNQKKIIKLGPLTNIFRNASLGFCDSPNCPTVVDHICETKYGQAFHVRQVEAEEYQVAEYLLTQFPKICPVDKFIPGQARLGNYGRVFKYQWIAREARIKNKKINSETKKYLIIYQKGKKPLVEIGPLLSCRFDQYDFKKIDQNQTLLNDFY